MSEPVISSSGGDWSSNALSNNVMVQLLTALLTFQNNVLQERTCTETMAHKVMFLNTVYGKRDKVITTRRKTTKISPTAFVTLL
ncbi:hypothetical protein GDO81_005286 [Engystomops pustulosus]|uniref:Uncharacterized protein n=1 Tax=Engystomops pustulosus TaxID=76066 RepID=A0AAV7CMA6_ENGPU|nr:hypothetical protein GDO81_005286 [Engystomops pustulosus]